MASFLFWGASQIEHLGLAQGFINKKNGPGKRIH